MSRALLDYQVALEDPELMSALAGDRYFFGRVADKCSVFVGAMSGGGHVNLAVFYGRLPAAGAFLLVLGEGASGTLCADEVAAVREVGGGLFEALSAPAEIAEERFGS